jgi:YD repeat-containing protein
LTIRRISRLLWMATAIAVSSHAGTPFSNCDVLHNGMTNAADVQRIVNEALGSQAPANDLNSDGMVNVVDVQIDIAAALGQPCVADPSLLSITPNTGQQGISGINVTILGHLTSFSDGSAVSLGDGITISNIAATNATTLTATLAIPSGASTGAQSLTVDGLTLANAFLVTVPISVSYTYDSQNRIATATYTLASGTTRTTTYTYDAAGNRTTVVGQ